MGGGADVVDAADADVDDCVGDISGASEGPPEDDAEEEDVEEEAEVEEDMAVGGDEDRGDFKDVCD